MKPPVLKIGVASILMWTGVILMILFLPPANFWVQLAFLVMTFLAFSSLLTLLIYGITHTVTDKHSNYNHHFSESMRRAVFVSLTLVLLALLKLAGLLTTTNTLLLTIAMLSLEFYFTKYRS